MNLAVADPKRLKELGPKAEPSSEEAPLAGVEAALAGAGDEDWLGEAKEQFAARDAAVGA